VPVGPASLTRLLQPRDAGGEDDYGADVPGVAGLLAAPGAGLGALAAAFPAAASGSAALLRSGALLQSLLPGYAAHAAQEPDIDALLAYIEGDAGKASAGTSSGTKAAGTGTKASAQPAGAAPAAPADVTPLALRRDRSGTVQSVLSNDSGSSEGYDEDTGTPTSTPHVGGRYRIEITSHDGGGDAAAVMAAKSKSQKRRDRAKARKLRQPPSAAGSAGGAAAAGEAAPVLSSAGGGAVERPPTAGAQHAGSGRPSARGSAAAASASSRGTSATRTIASHGGSGSAATAPSSHTAGSVSAGDPRDVWSAADGTTTSGTSPPLRAVGQGAKSASLLPRHVTAPLSLGPAALAASVGPSSAHAHRRPGQQRAAAATIGSRHDGSPAPSDPVAALRARGAAGMPSSKAPPPGVLSPPPAAAAPQGSAPASPLLGGARGAGVAQIKQQLLSGKLALDGAAVDALFSEDAFDDSDENSELDDEVERFKQRLGLAPAGSAAMAAAPLRAHD
jgi:hypothetical protein